MNNQKWWRRSCCCFFRRRRRLSLSPFLADVHCAGFVTIDCGLPERAAGYVDNGTKLSFTLDASFINAHKSAEYVMLYMGKSFHNVRSFGAGVGASMRNCWASTNGRP